MCYMLAGFVQKNEKATPTLTNATVDSTSLSESYQPAGRMYFVLIITDCCHCLQKQDYTHLVLQLVKLKIYYE